MSEEKFEEMSLIGHLTELRKRLLWSFLYISKVLFANLSFIFVLLFFQWKSENNC